MSKFLSSLGIGQSELRLLDSVPAEEVAELLADTGNFEQDLWRLPSGEVVNFEMASWETERPGGPPDLWRAPDSESDAAADDGADASATAASGSLLERLPARCLSAVAAALSLRDLAAACAASPAMGRHALTDACWAERLRRHAGPGHLRGCFASVARDPCCANPLARLFCHVLLGLYRCPPEGGGTHLGGTSWQDDSAADGSTTATNGGPQRLVPDACLGGALFPGPVLSPVFLGRPLYMEFRFPRVHAGRYDALLRVKKLLCSPLDPESVASAADNSGVPLLQTRINRRSVTISNFECKIEVTATAPNGGQEEAAAVILREEAVSHLLQNYSMPPDRWFYWRLATLVLRPGGTVSDLRARVTVTRRGVANATVTQEEFERELRNALLTDHLFLRLREFLPAGAAH